MAPTIQTIGIANGGGDCPGLNAVIRGAVRASILGHGWRVVGINDGFDGLIWTERTVPLTVESIAGILPRGGTILGTTNRGNPFHYDIEENGKKVSHDYSLTCRDNMRKLGLDAIIAIGGDGTLTIARDLGRLGIPIVGVPKTIDNDLSATEVTFGFDTALHVAARFGVEAVELIASGELERMVCLRAGEIASVSLDEAVGETRLVDPKGSMVRTARALGMNFGDQA